jgi:endonuclease/exonuclease/phosphatase family metal-dependent hydrolase
MRPFPFPSHPAFRRRLALLLAAAVAGGLWLASRPVPTGPAEGRALAGEVHRPPAARTTLRIGTFNIHGCRDADGRRDVDRTARCLEDLDFAALEEVHGPPPWQRLDQAGELGVRLGLAWLFAPNTRTWYCLDTGNGLLSALEVRSWQRIPLPHVLDPGYRNAVLVELEHRGRTVHVLLTHVTRHDDRSRHEQLRAVADRFLALDQPAILLGDLNSNADDDEVRRLLAAPGVRDPLGETLGANAPPRIDWILTRGMRCVTAGLRDDGASDHPLVWAELE